MFLKNLRWSLIVFILEAATLLLAHGVKGEDPELPVLLAAAIVMLLPWFFRDGLAAAASASFATIIIAMNRGPMSFAYTVFILIFTLLVTVGVASLVTFFAKEEKEPLWPATAAALPFGLGLLSGLTILLWRWAAKFVRCLLRAPS